VTSLRLRLRPQVRLLHAHSLIDGLFHLFTALGSPIRVTSQIGGYLPRGADAILVSCDKDLHECVVDVIAHGQVRVPYSRVTQRPNAELRTASSSSSSSSAGAGSSLAATAASDDQPPPASPREPVPDPAAGLGQAREAQPDTEREREESACVEGLRTAVDRLTLENKVKFYYSSRQGKHQHPSRSFIQPVRCLS